MATFTIEEILAIKDSELVCNIAGDNKTSKYAIATDTRELKAGEIFLALAGENFDGANFAKDALAKRASGIVIGEGISSELLNELAKKAREYNAFIIKAPDTLKFYQALATLHRRKFDLPIIAITGSNGKTTTKDIMAAVLAGKYGEEHILKTEANFNNEIGLPLTLLKLTKEHRACVLEMGMRGLGQIAELTEIASPNIAIVTNVGETHMELLGTIENIAKAKGELVESLDGGIAIINADDVHTLAMRALAKKSTEIISYGIAKGDILAEGISQYGNMLSFMVRYNDERHEYRLDLVGRHNVYNTLATIAAGLRLGLTPQEIQNGLKKLKPSPMRYEQEKIGKYLIINDAYNASPLSMKTAIETTASLYQGRKIAVLADMLELGDAADKAHLAVGRLATEKGFDVLIAYGDKGRLIKVGADSAGIKESYHFLNRSELSLKLIEVLEEGDTVLVKGSRGMRLEKVIEAIKSSITEDSENKKQK